MRSPIVLLGIFVLTAVLGPVVVIAGLLGIEEKPDGVYQWCIHTWCRAILWMSGVKVVVDGAEKLSATRGVVYIANHVSWYDIFALAAVIPRSTWIAKAELRRIPLFGRAADAFGIIFIDRDNRKAAFESYNHAAQQVRRGRSVVICPEGTRGRDYHLRPFKKGPFVLAIAAEADVIPTVIHGTREIMAKGSFMIRSGTVHIHFLDPVSSRGYAYEDRTQLMEKVWARMAEEMRNRYGIHTAEHAVAPEGERKE